ncbi:ABC transporter permease [Aeromicrobium sp. Leaf350]|uniref:ABC transporter permease n=1 Tax=Aeromicrobium sp. Leaf350 TaxID=2876565 RepID=UPI001E36D8A7|nr:ABC transporter permease [Aeromicrobium sp. Leaf350]
MLTFAARRLGILLITLVLVTVIGFLLIHITPGDPAVAAAGPDADQATIAATRTELGLDRPLIVQFWEYMTGLVRLDFGTSFDGGRPVLDAITDRLPATLSLVVASLLVALLISIPLGVGTAVHRGTIWDRIGVLLASLGVALPDFFVGLVLVLVLALQLGMFDATGYVPLFDDPIQWAYLLVLPALTLGTTVAAELTRHIRASVSDVLELDYVRTARAKGLGSTRVILKHASRNAAMPVVTVFGNQIARLLGGTVIVEQIFSIPGIGQLLVQSVFTRDIPMVLGIGIFIAMIVLLVNVLIDLSYGWLNPKVRA